MSEQESSHHASTAVRWTKDSVDHVRGLHITLITISAGLLLLVASAKPYRPKALIQIAEIVELKQHWSPFWIWQHRLWTNDTSVERSDLDLKNLLEISPGVLVDPAVKIAPVMIATVYNSKVRGLNLGDQLEVYTPQDVWLVQSVHGFLVQKDDPQLLSDPISIYSFPENLSQFEKWWNDLKTGRTILHPETLSGVSIMVNGSDQTVAKLAVVSKDTHSGKLHVLRTISARPVLHPILSLRDQISYEAYDPVANLTLMMPLAESMSFKVNQDLLKSWFNWPTGSYDASFAELVKATKDMEYMPLDDLQKNMAADAAKGPETFEAFGVKLPAEQITTAGIILVLAIQLYLFLCFKQRSIPIASDDPVRGVPWIGFDQSVFGKLVFFVSLALATVAIASLATNAMLHLIENDSAWTSKAWDWGRMPPQQRARIFAQTAIFLAGMGVSAYLWLASWWNRPQMATSSTDGQTKSNPELQHTSRGAFE